MPDLEIIAVDPNCYYSSSEDEIENAEIGYDTDQMQFLSPREKLTDKNSILSSESQLSYDDAFDIITLDIDDHLNDDLLFIGDRNENHQFDLASYIAGDSCSLSLASPPSFPQNNEHDPMRCESINATLNSSITKSLSNTIYVDNKWQRNQKSFEQSRFKNNNLKHPMKRNEKTPINISKDILKRQVYGNIINKAKSIPSNRSSLSSEKMMITRKKVSNVGLGRGKDIAVAAKYYCDESSDNNDIYSESNNKTTTSIVAEKSIDNNDKRSPSLRNNKVLKKQIASTMIEQKSNGNTINEEICPIANKKPKVNVPIVPITIDCNSMDSSDFAKALEINAKIPVRVKMNSMKKQRLEEQKRLISSKMLIENPAKFKVSTARKTILPSGESSPNYKSSMNMNRSVESAEFNISQNSTEDEIMNNNTFPNKINENESGNTVIENSIQNDEDSKNTNSESSNNESNIKRKLNIQEYLKRKTITTIIENGLSIKKENMEKIKVEPIEENKTKEDESVSNTIKESMYEEIIIVSIGCNTDVSIPEASFIQASGLNDDETAKSTALLSNIQTTVEKANSSTENSKISSLSLISSIQSVILKKANFRESTEKIQLKKETDELNDGDEEDDLPEHGENKVIMHLPKDRARPTTVTISMQTDSYFQFPPLERLSLPTKKHQFKQGDGASKNELSDEIFFDKMNFDASIQQNNRNYGKHQYSSDSSDCDEEKPVRRSRHSDFFNPSGNTHSKLQKRSRRKRNNSSKWDRHIERNRTISRSLSQSSDSSSSSSDSSSSSRSWSSSDSGTSSEMLHSSSRSTSRSTSTLYHSDDDNRNSSMSSSSRSRLLVSNSRSKSPGKMINLI